MAQGGGSPARSRRPKPGAALAALKVPVCPLVKEAFDSQNWADHQPAALALATAGEAACLPGLTTLLGNTKAHPEARAAAAVALGTIEDPAAKKALADAAKDEPTRRFMAPRCWRRSNPAPGGAR